jgi:hypothetical protein
MPKPGEKLPQVLTVVAVWGFLLALFLGYERYFVTRQEAFLTETAFHSLQRVAHECQAQVERAKISTNSYIQLATGSGQPRSAAPPKALRHFLNLYLKDVREAGGNASELSIARAKACPIIGGLPIGLQAESHGAALTFFCADEHKAIYTLNLTAWFKSALEPLAPDFDDLIIADETGNVVFQKSSSLRTIANLKPVFLTSGTTPLTGGASTIARRAVQPVQRYRDSTVSRRRVLSLSAALAAGSTRCFRFRFASHYSGIPVVHPKQPRARRRQLRSPRGTWLPSGLDLPNASRRMPTLSRIRP